MIARYFTHPEVIIDPDIPVEKWGLSDVGLARVETLINSRFLEGTTHVVSSAEKKALDASQPISNALGASLEVRERTHENDRTTTGYLPGPEFEATANAFFAQPDVSVRGWETANDAQSRIVGEVEKVLQNHTAGDLLIVGHGGVGTLLYCHLAHKPISREFDQHGGGGCLFSFDIKTRTPLSHSMRLEDMAA